jgi:predicted MFS family arabinose efflux permease
MRTPMQKNPMDAGTVIAAAIIASAIGALFYNVLPIFMGTAQDYRGLDNREIGFLSSAFFLGYNVATISAFFWIRRLSWSLVVAIAAPIAALSLYAGTLFDSYSALLLLVAISGGAFAAIYGVGTTILGDTTNPARWFGVKIAAEAMLGALLLLVLPVTTIALWGFDGTAIGVIIAMVFLAPFLFWLPSSGAKGVEHDQPISGPEKQSQTPYIWGALAATLVFFAGASAIWAFIERIGAQRGFEPAAVGILLSVTLIFALIGSLLAAAMGGKFGNVKPFIVGAALSLVALLFLNSPQSFAVYAAGACLQTFVIGLLLPFAITEVADLDVDGRYIVLSVPAIGIGAMAGPGIAGILAQSGNFSPLLVFVGATAVVSSILITVSAARARPGATPTRI